MILNRNERLKHFRKFLKLNQDQMGEKLGMTRATYSVIENGGGISEQYLLPLYELGVSLDWLFAGRGDMLRNGEPQSIQIGALNTGVAGHVTNTYNNITECEKELAVMEERLAAARREIELKDEIIILLKGK